MPKKRQEKIKAKANKYILEYETLAALRKTIGVTQEDIAKKQGVKQVNISNLEKRHDMLISTLHHYVHALGGKLEIKIRMPTSGLVTVKNLNAMRSSTRTAVAARKVAARKAAAK